MGNKSLRLGKIDIGLATKRHIFDYRLFFGSQSPSRDSANVSCACELTQLFCVAFHQARDGHKCHRVGFKMSN